MDSMANLSRSLPPSSDWVAFNVGGTVFKTTKATLGKDKVS